MNINLHLLSRRISSYKENPNKIWDVGGDQFESLNDINFGSLEFEDLSFDEPKLEAILFDGTDENRDENNALND